jgi:hypothetical protein
MGALSRELNFISECRWKGGRLSETEVTETLSVQSLACLP